MRISIFLLVLAILFICSVAYADINPYATGHEWLRYSERQKTELIATLYYILKVDESQYPAENGVKALDVMYTTFSKKGMRSPDASSKDAVELLVGMPCIKVLADILTCKE